jgi:hypothetical protein
MDTLETEPRTNREWVDSASQFRVEGGEEPYLLMDDFDDCIVGIADRFNHEFVVYDKMKVLAKLVERDGMTREEADEYYSFNILGGWHGERTVAFIEFPKLRGES